MLKRAFLIDDDAVFRLGLSRALLENFGVGTVGADNFGADRTDAIHTADADAVFFSPPSLTSESNDWLRQLLMPPRDFVCVMLIGHRLKACAREYSALGLDGFLLKPLALAELQNLIAALRRNEPYLSSNLAETGSLASSADGLSERELLIVRRTADGRSSAQIAAEFGISIKTAERYRRSLFAKLGLHSVAELTKYAVREGYTAL